jgi:hypothetical protein
MAFSIVQIVGLAIAVGVLLPALLGNRKRLPKGTKALPGPKG